MLLYGIFPDMQTQEHIIINWSWMPPWKFASYDMDVDSGMRYVNAGIFFSFLLKTGNEEILECNPCTLAAKTKKGSLPSPIGIELKPATGHILIPLYGVCYLTSSKQ